MPFYQWDPQTLSVKVKEMDDMHQVLINKMNSVFDAWQAKKPKAEIEKIIVDFAGYVTQHFRDEEAYMEKIKFPGLPVHKVVHEQLLVQASQHIEDFKRTGNLPDTFFKFLSVWLTSHIRGIDMKYSPGYKG